MKKYVILGPSLSSFLEQLIYLLALPLDLMPTLFYLLLD